MTTTTGLATLAARVWEMLVREEMPVVVCIDYMRDELDTDDVRALKKALYEAAADDIKKRYRRHKHKGNWNLSIPAICSEIGKGSFEFVSRTLTHIRTHSKAMKGNPAWSDWSKWCDRADLALNLCRRIEELPQ